MKWKQLEEMVKDAGIHTDRLVVVIAGQDTIIGELFALGDVTLPRNSPVARDLVDQVVTLRNAKRVVTLKMQTPQGIAMNTFISPLELMDGGDVAVKPTTAFVVDQASDGAKEQIFGLLANHIVEERKNRAMEAGIELAPGPLPTATQSGGRPTRLSLR